MKYDLMPIIAAYTSGDASGDIMLLVMFISSIVIIGILTCPSKTNGKLTTDQVDTKYLQPDTKPNI